MSRNGSGDFSLLATFATAGQAPSASSHNAIMADIAQALSDSINKDGTKAFAANQSFGNFRATTLGTGTARTDGTNVGAIQDGKLNWADGGGTADAITATYAPALTALVDGQLCCVRATAANATTTPTFAPNGLTARTIVKSGGAALVAGDISGDGHELILRYDLTNTRWELLNPKVATPTAASATEILTGTDTAKFATADSVAALWEQGADVASATAISLGEGGYFNITGTTTITDIDFATDKAGRRAWLKFAAALTLTHSSTLILPGAVNIVTAAGDTAEFISEGSDTVRCVSYQRAAVPPTTQTGSAPVFAARAWVVFNGTGTPAISASGNVSSITDNGVGDYTINFTTALPSANYAVVGSAAHSTRNATVTVDTTTSPTTTAVRIQVGAVDLNAATASADAYDSDRVSVVVFG